LILRIWWYVLFKFYFFSKHFFVLKPRFCNQLELHQENLIQRTAVYIAERAKEICDIQSRAPDSIAGASIYMACAAAGERKLMKGINKLINKNFI
jgi:transcription initiation factor TFIIIB Brf1 subunit/transcription initiation factor TFIIB